MSAVETKEPIRPEGELEWLGIKSGDPVARNHQGYWFADETWSDIHGPFADEAAARAELARYSHWLETGEALPKVASETAQG